MNNLTQPVSVGAGIIISLFGSTTVLVLVKLHSQIARWDFVNVKKSSIKIFNKQDPIPGDVSPGMFGKNKRSLGYFLGDVEVDVSHLRIYFFDYITTLLEYWHITAHLRREPLLRELVSCYYWL